MCEQSEPSEDLGGSERKVRIANDWLIFKILNDE